MPRPRTANTRPGAESALAAEIGGTQVRFTRTERGRMPTLRRFGGVSPSDPFIGVPSPTLDRRAFHARFEAERHFAEWIGPGTRPCRSLRSGPRGAAAVPFDAAD